MNWESAPKVGIGTQVRSDFLRLVLQNQSPRGLERMVVRQRQINGLIEADQSRILPNRLRHSAAGKTSRLRREFESIVNA